MMRAVLSSRRSRPRVDGAKRPGPTLHAMMNWIGWCLKRARGPVWCGWRGNHQRDLSSRAPHAAEGYGPLRYGEIRVNGAVQGARRRMGTGQRACQHDLARARTDGPDAELRRASLQDGSYDAATRLPRR